MKLIHKISLITSILFFTISCVQDDDYSIPQSLGLEENQNLNILLAEIESGNADLISISDLKMVR